MKNPNYFLTILLCALLLACNQDDNCDGTFTIESVVPSSNLPGSEILIKGEGLSEDTEVRFAGQLAKTSFSEEKGITATVPKDVIGFLDLTVEEGNCLARADFEVLGALPVNWVASPTVIITPILPPNFPSNITNNWINYFDNDHSLTLSQDGDCFGQEEQEIEFSTENHTTNPFLNNNPITGKYLCKDRILEINIDRTAKGGKVEMLTGSVIEAETIGEDDSDGRAYMLLTSKITGRQYVFFRN